MHGSSLGPQGAQPRVAGQAEKDLGAALEDLSLSYQKSIEIGGDKDAST